MLIKEVGRSVHGLAKLVTKNTNVRFPKLTYGLILVACEAGKSDLGRAVWSPAVLENGSGLAGRVCDNGGL